MADKSVRNSVLESLKAKLESATEPEVILGIVAAMERLTAEPGNGAGTGEPESKSPAGLFNAALCRNSNGAWQLHRKPVNEVTARWIDKINALEPGQKVGPIAKSHRADITSMFKANGIANVDAESKSGEYRTFRRSGNHPIYGNADGATLILRHTPTWSFFVERSK